MDNREALRVEVIEIPGRESVPNTLLPPPGYRPTLTRDRLARSVLSDARRRACGLVNATGRPLSPRAVAMLGKPCPLGRSSKYGYEDLGCRCEGCRRASSAARLARLHRAATNIGRA